MYAAVCQSVCVCARKRDSALVKILPDFAAHMEHISEQSLLKWEEQQQKVEIYRGCWGEGVYDAKLSSERLLLKYFFWVRAPCVCDVWPRLCPVALRVSLLCQLFTAGA